MQIIKRPLWTFVALGYLGTACSGGPENPDNPLDRVEPYALTCAETVCGQQRKECEARSTQRCHDCYDTCGSPFQSDPALCASICHSICQSNCSSCSASDDRCTKQGIVFNPPAINPDIEREARGIMAECSPNAPAEPSVQFMARSFRHEYVDVLRCVREHDCDGHGCGSGTKDGTVGAAICQRQDECGSPCSQEDPGWLNMNEFQMRPELAAQFWRCAREADCAVAIACWQALQPAAGIGNYPKARSNGGS